MPWRLQGDFGGEVGSESSKLDPPSDVTKHTSVVTSQIKAKKMRRGLMFVKKKNLDLLKIYIVHLALPTLKIFPPLPTLRCKRK